MMRLRRFAIAVLASVTVVVGSLATPSTASAMDCMSARVVEDLYSFTACRLIPFGQQRVRVLVWQGRRHHGRLRLEASDSIDSHRATVTRARFSAHAALPRRSTTGCHLNRSRR